MIFLIVVASGYVFVIIKQYNELLTCIGEMWHIVISAAALFDNEVSDAFPVAGRLRVTTEVAQLLVFLTVTVWWRQVGFLQYQHSTDEWLRVSTQAQPVNVSHTVTVWWRQVGLLQYQHSTDEWLRVSTQAQPVNVSHTVTVWWRQFSFLQYQLSTDEWLRVPTQTQPMDTSHSFIGCLCILLSQF